MCPGGAICSRSVLPKDTIIFCPISSLVWYCFLIFFFPWNLHVWKTRFSVWSRCLYLLSLQLTWRLQLVQAADKWPHKLAFLRGQKCLIYKKPTRECTEHVRVCMCLLAWEFSFACTCKCKDLQTEGMQEPLGYNCVILIFCCYQSGQDLNSGKSNEG